MSRYADEIRRIAKGDKRKGPLGNAGERDPILGTFIPFINTPLNQITSNGASGVDPADVNAPDSDGAADDPTNPDNQNDQPTDGNDPNTFNKGSATQGSTSNTHTVSDVIEQTGTAPSAPNENNYTNSGEQNTSGIIDHLSGATDCTTGQGINFHTDGNFPAPDGWADPDSPPVPDPPEGYTEGFYWTRDGSCFAPDPVGAYECLFPTEGTVSIVEFDSGFVASISGNFALVTYTVKITNKSTGNVTFSTTADGATRSACPGSPSGGVAIACAYNPEDDTPTSWPTDGNYDLTLNGGSFGASQYDSEAPANSGGSAADFCYTDGEGNPATGSIEATANGGFMIYKTGAGAPTGTVSVYGQDGTFQGAGDATESFMNQWRPK